MVVGVEIFMVVRDDRRPMSIIVMTKGEGQDFEQAEKNDVKFCREH